MPSLIFIKHAKPQRDDSQPAHRWPLSDEGRAAAELLAHAIKRFEPSVVACSDEPKAMQTAQIVAEALGIDYEVDSDLAEHDRTSVPMMPTREFISSMALLFSRPQQLVLGDETAEQASSRFERAVNRAIEKHFDQNIAIVSHGTVLALHAAPLLERPEFELWRQMGQPSFLAFDRPSMKLLERCDQLE